MRNVLPRVALVAGLGFFFVVGVFAFFWPHEFFENVAQYPPYNEHLFHDIGAFNLGLGTAFAAALLVRSSVVVVLLGGAVGSVFHALAHFMDRDLGGKNTDPWTLGAFALLMVAGAVLARSKSET